MNYLKSFKDFVTSSTRNKVIFGVSVLLLVEGAVYLARKRRAQQTPVQKKEIEVVGKDSYVMEQLASEACTTYEEENPLLGKSKEVVKLLLPKLRQSQSLRLYFTEEMLRENSLYAINMQKYIMNAMGGPYNDFVVDLKEKHKKLKISRDTYREFVKLWIETERELGIKGKDIWGEIEDEVVY